jgi:hypothetical protein
MATPKATTAKTTTSKTTSPAKKPVTTKAATNKKPAATKKAAPKSGKIGPEERYRMVEVAAYFLAERNGFTGSPVDYWTAAEIQITKLLSK